MSDTPGPIHIAKSNTPKPAESSIFDKIISQGNNFLPWERVQLPSKGVYYKNMPDGYVEVRPMGVDVDKILSNQRIAQSGELLNKVVEACVRLPDGFDVSDMLTGDQYFLLYYLRGITHGPDYEFTSTCPFCENKAIYNYNLAKLSETIKGPLDEFHTEPFELVLPKLSEWAKKNGATDDVIANIRLMRVKDITAMSKKANEIEDETFDPVAVAEARNRGSKGAKKAPKTSVDDTYVNSLKLTIISFKIGNEVCDGPKRVKLINMLHQADTAEIKKFLDKVTPSIDTSIEVTCQNAECKKEYVINLPFGEEFFRPS